MERKTTRGRQKIAIRRIERESDRFATFSKRRLGILRKASDLSTLCDVDIGVVIYSPTGKPFSFFSPTMESVIGRVDGNPDNSDGSRLVEAFTRTRVFQLNQMIDKLSDQLEAEKKLEEELEKTIKNEASCSLDELRIERFSKEQLVACLGNLQDVLNGKTSFN